MSRKIFLFLFFFFVFASPFNKFVERTEFLLGTVIQIKIEKVKDSDKILNSAFELIKNFEDRFSIFKQESEISKLNKYKKLKVSSDLLNVIKKAIYISEITDGAFDITCKPIIDLYKEKSKENKTPAEKEIEEVLKNVGWRKIKIKDDFVILSDNMEIDLGGIAKGYIVDKTFQFLKSNGIKNGLINAGGDIYCWGFNEKGEKWKIGIENPFEESKIIGIFEITDKGIATSGNYKRYLEIKKKKIGHIINPRTGLPTGENIASVTVIANDCTIADGFATGIFVLGIEKGLKVINKLKDVECLIIDKNGKIYTSSGFPKFSPD
jgi:thiamine biosynthesis lipoprotein